MGGWKSGVAFERNDISEICPGELCVYGRVKVIGEHKGQGLEWGKAEGIGEEG